jgi:hypothetical protein
VPICPREYYYVRFLTGRIFVDGSGICVEGPDFAARQNSAVQYRHAGARTEIVVLEGSLTMRRPTTVTLMRFELYAITNGKVDGPPGRILPQQADRLAAWRAGYFRTRVPAPPSSPPQPAPPSREPQPGPSQPPSRQPQPTPPLREIQPAPPGPEPRGYCCLPGGLTPTTAGRCQAAGGRFYTDEATARKACPAIR